MHFVRHKLKVVLERLKSRASSILVRPPSSPSPPIIVATVYIVITVRRRAGGANIEMAVAVDDERSQVVVDADLTRQECELIDYLIRSKDVIQEFKT